MGGVANMFPKRADAEQIIRHVAKRLDAADGEPAPHYPSGIRSEGAVDARM